MPFLFRKLCIQFCLVGFGVFPASLIWSCCTLCSAIDCLVRFPKQARLTPQNRSLFDKQCINVKYLEVMKMELQRNNRVCAGWVTRFLFPCVELSDNRAEVEHFFMYIRCLILNCNLNFASVTADSTSFPLVRSRWYNCRFYSANFVPTYITSLVSV